MATTLARIPKVKSLIAKNNAKLQSDKKQSKITRASREAAVRRYERELKALETKLETKRGIERLPVVKGRVEVAPDADVVGSESLPARKIGPVVRKIGAGQGPSSSQAFSSSHRDWF
jgi:hypothetical protein